ncbi:MAG: AI-2E family transporter [Candidatus Thiodiazotropha sp. (ex Semelilucina semeliformis)]|nr:AI-2E family transporter [Candidatus Thiodiazotropha sp. (ex Semelilucina semeliformis)]
MSTVKLQATPAVHFLLALAAFVVIVAGMRAADALLVPFLLSLFIAVIAAPPLFFLKERGVPSGLAMLAVIAMIIVFGMLIGWMIGGSLNDFTKNLPQYQERLSVQSGRVVTWLQAQGLEFDQEALKSFINPGKAMGMAGQVISGLGNVLTQALLILITVIFMLVEATAFQGKIQAISDDPDVSLARVNAITESIKRYMMIKTSTSLLTGVLITVWLWILGVDYPVLWGVLAFLFNYVPNIGSIIAAVPAVLLAVVQTGVSTALWVAAGYLVVNNLVGNMIEPRYMGKGLGLSPLVVFISLVFWGWVLGPVGMFLSVPLTMTLKIFLDGYESSQSVGHLLGSRESRE